MNPEQIPLRDLHLPEAIGWWPPAPGWWVLLALVAAGLAFAAWCLILRHRRDAARRLALAELRRLRTRYEADGDLAGFAIAVSALLRRAMLAYAPRHEVAGLTGAAWLEWLDRGLDRRPFSQGAGQTLTELPYRHPARGPGGDIDVDALVEAVRRRLETPLPEPG